MSDANQSGQNPAGDQVSGSKISIGGDAGSGAIVAGHDAQVIYNVDGNLIVQAAQAASAQQRDLSGMLRVLVVLAGPIASHLPGTREPARLNLRAEWKRLAEAVRASRAPIALIRLSPPTLDALRWALGPRAVEQGLAPHVVHFTGHGWKEGLLFEDELGRSQPVQAEALVEVFRQAGVRLGVFNACETAAEAYSAAQLLVERGGLQAAVGHREPVLDQTAIQFAARLYAELAQGGLKLGQAVDSARQAIAGRLDA